MRRISIDNRTRYSTRNIITLLSRVHADYLTRFNSPRTVRVTVKYRVRNRWGYAYYNSNLVTLNLPRDGKADVEQVAHTFQHELDHCRGVRHSDMGECNRHREGEAWHKGRTIPDVSDITIAHSDPPAKKQPTLDDKVVRLIQRKERWEAKKRRAETAIKKINRSLSYYEKRKAALS